MADPQGGETIRQMLAGFNSMQMQLGLLPMQNQASPMGVPFQPPPPPPQIPHPSQSGVYAVQQQMQQMQQTLQASQMTRYVPPPSTPIGGGGGAGWGGSMNTLASNQFNPIMAGVMSGGGGGGMPSPMMMTAPQYGGYRPGGPMASPLMGPSRVPSIFNPFSPMLPGSHFQSPAMQHLQVMQAHQSQFTGMLGGAVQGGLGVGGSMIGAGIGSMFGPLGTMAGSYLGGKLGGAIGDMTIGPALADMAHGRQLQNMSAPWMVSGGMLNPFTGQGMERGAARQTATGLRHMVRDQDFEKTGFNTQDVMRITQLASDQGLLTTARNPEDLTRKIKDISKAVKNIIAITGDPDVRDAIQSLGQMRNMGFMGLSGQMGAVANRTAFSRMAGVSQSAMDQMYGSPGAMMGQQLGLSGATGYMAGMGGGGFANIAASSGSLNELQLARAGGKQGLGQINTMAALGAANQDIYMASAIRRGKGGKWSVDVDAYRQSQGMDIDEVARRAGSNLHAAGMNVSEISTRRQEFKDILAQSMSPAEMQLNALKQAQAMSKKTGLGLGASLKTMLMSSGQYGSDQEAETAARSLEAQYHSGSFYDGLQQQFKQQGRDAQDRVRARRDRYRTPGVGARMGHSIREGLGEMGDWISSPFAAMGEHTDRAAEDRALQGRGEYAHRYRQSQLIDSPQARQMAIAAMGRQGFQKSFGQLGSDPFATGGGFGNTFAHGIGYSAYDDANAMNDLANRTDTSAFGMHPLSSFGDVGRSRRRVASVSRVGDSVDAAMNMTGDKRMAMHRHINESAKLSGMKNFDASSFAQEASVQLRKILPTAGGIGNAGAATEQHFIQAVRNAARQNGQDEDEAVRAFIGNDKGAGMRALISEQVFQTKDTRAQEVLSNSQDVRDKAHALQGQRGRRTDKDIGDTFSKFGLTGRDTGAIESTKALFKNRKVDAIALAAAKNSAGTDKSRATLKALRAKYSPEEFASLEQEAAGITEGASGDTMSHLNKVLETGKGGLANFGTVAENVGADMATQAEKSVLEQIGKPNAGDPLEAMKDLTDKEIAAIKNPKLKAAALALKNHEKGAVGKAREAIAGAGPKQTTEISGGMSGLDTNDSDALISEVQKLKEENASAEDGGDPQAQMWMSTAQILAGAAKDLKGAADIMKIKSGNPFWPVGGA